jgi:hypothetical protein
LPRLRDLATVIRNKNAGPFEVTLDVIFSDEALYRKVKAGGDLTRDRVAEMYRLPLSEVPVFIALRGQRLQDHPAPADPSGNIGDPDVLGAQQHASLMDVEVRLGENS